MGELTMDQRTLIRDLLTAVAKDPSPTVSNQIIQSALGALDLFWNRFAGLKGNAEDRV